MMRGRKVDPISKWGSIVFGRFNSLAQGNVCVCMQGAGGQILSGIIVQIILFLQMIMHRHAYSAALVRNTQVCERSVS